MGLNLKRGSLFTEGTIQFSLLVIGSRRVRSFFGGEVHFKLEWALFSAVLKIYIYV